MARKGRTPPPPRRVQAPKPRREARQGGKRLWIAAAVLALLVLAGGAAVATMALGGGGGGEGDACARETFPDQGREHVTRLPRDFEYNSFPATSGLHHPQPAIWNVYDDPVPQIHLVHNLEHGGIVVQYGPEVPQETVNEIIAWYREDPNGIIVAPLPDVPEADELSDKIALTAWTHLAVCSTFDEEEFSAFRDDYRGKGPEEFPEEALEPGT